MTAFTVPPSESDKPENRFEFEVEDEVYSVPLLKYAPIEASILFERGWNIEGCLECVRDNPDAAAAIRRMDRDQFSALEAAWIAASKVSPGESDGSDDS